MTGIWPHHLIRFQQLAPFEPGQRRVLFITNMWPDEIRPYYGSFIASQAQSLVTIGVSVDVLYIRGFLGVHAYLSALFESPRVARRRFYDLVHVHYGHTAASSIGVRRRPLIVSFCGEDLLGAPRDGGITRKSQVEIAIFRQVARTATATITKSAEMEQVLPPDVRRRNFILPNGVDLAMFTPRPRIDAREQLGWPTEGHVVLFLGDPADPRKNVALAHAVTAVVQAQLPAARLEVAWGVRPDEVPALMNASDCLLFTSRSEGSPNAVKEAMACALPVVATPVGDIPERLNNVSHCYICEPFPDSLARAVVQALGDGRAPAARRAVEGLDANLVAHKLVSIYDVAERRHRARANIAAHQQPR